MGFVKSAYIWKFIKNVSSIFSVFKIKSIKIFQTIKIHIRWNNFCPFLQSIGMYVHTENGCLHTEL